MWQPTILLMCCLAGLGGYFYCFTDNDILWSGYGAMCVFFGAIFFVGSYAAKNKNIRTETDLMLAGRALPLGIAVFTMSAAWIDGGYINGTAEGVAKNGLLWVQAPWGYALSMMVGGLLFAKRMRRYGFHTMLDPFHQRFGRRVAALLFLPALAGELCWTAAILAALGSTFATVLNLDFTTSVLISATIAVAYTAMGGLWSVAYTDTVQFFLLMLGLIIVVPFALEKVGGLHFAWGLYEQKMGPASSPVPSPAGMGDHFWNWCDYALLLVFGGIPWGAYFQRILGAKDDRTAVRTSVAAGFICLCAAVPPALVGIVGAVFPEVSSWKSVGAGTPPDLMIFPYVLRYLTPPVVGMLGLGAVAAAVMSSVDASILSASSMTSWNIYRPLFKPKASPAQLMKVLKRFVFVIGATGALLAIRVQSVYALWVLCSDFVYCLLFPALVSVLFDKKANAAGVVAGFAVAFVLRFGGGEKSLGLPLLFPYPMVENGVSLFPFRTLAMLSGLATIWVISRLTQRVSPPVQLIPVGR